MVVSPFLLGNLNPPNPSKTKGVGKKEFSPIRLSAEGGLGWEAFPQSLLKRH